jgi:hypothetical protein
MAILSNRANCNLQLQDGVLQSEENLSEEQEREIRKKPEDSGRPIPWHGPS